MIELMIDMITNIVYLHNERRNYILYHELKVFCKDNFFERSAFGDFGDQYCFFYSSNELLRHRIQC